MNKRIAINGLGRIGRTVLKELINHDDVDIVAVNDLSDIDEIAYLLKYDSVHGKFNKEIVVDDDTLIIDGKRIKTYSERAAENLPWHELGVDLVLECTGIYTKREDAEKHITAGAKHVLISAPGKGDMKTIVFGVNEKTLTKDSQIISAASCTTNCLAPVLKVISECFGIEGGYMSTVHAYTNDQVNLDVHHNKGYQTRRGRACAINCVPTSTGAASAIGKVLPELDGLIKGTAYRVPLSDGSMVDAYLMLKKKTTVEEVNTAFEQASSDTLKITYDPIVSSDVIGESCGALVDCGLTEIVEIGKKQMLKVTAWYDNEYGYSMQMVRTILYLLNII